MPYFLYIKKPFTLNKNQVLPLDEYEFLKTNYKSFLQSEKEAVKKEQKITLNENFNFKTINKFFIYWLISLFLSYLLLLIFPSIKKVVEYIHLIIGMIIIFGGYFTTFMSRLITMDSFERYYIQFKKHYRKHKKAIDFTATYEEYVKFYTKYNIY